METIIPPSTSATSSRLYWLSISFHWFIEHIFSCYSYLTRSPLFFVRTWLKLRSQQLPCVFLLKKKQLPGEALVSLSWPQWNSVVHFSRLWNGISGIFYFSWNDCKKDTGFCDTSAYMKSFGDKVNFRVTRSSCQKVIPQFHLVQTTPPTSFPKSHSSTAEATLSTLHINMLRFLFFFFLIWTECNYVASFSKNLTAVFTHLLPVR